MGNLTEGCGERQSCQEGRMQDTKDDTGKELVGRRKGRFPCLVDRKRPPPATHPGPSAIGSWQPNDFPGF